MPHTAPTEQSPAGQQLQLQQYFQNLFHIADRNQNGILEAAELCHLLELSGFNFSRPSIESAIKQAWDPFPGRASTRPHYRIYIYRTSTRPTFITQTVSLRPTWMGMG